MQITSDKIEEGKENIIGSISKIKNNDEKDISKSKSESTKNSPKSETSPIKVSIENKSKKSIEKIEGHPINIIYFDDEENVFKLNSENLEKVLCNERIQDLPVSLISICGAFRKGKSFFMTIVLNYLQKRFKSCQDFEWNQIDTLKGFKFQSGSKRTTSGVMMWSEAFIVTRDDQSKFAILLMDTQGLFDSNTSIRECSSIFALTTLVSSQIIYNLHQQIQEDDLNNLLFFAEYGKLLSTQTGTKPFHDLTFLVRDWQWSEDFDFGPNQSYIESVLSEANLKSEDLKKTRALLKQLFSSLNAILLPYPGSKVARSCKDECKVELLDEEFRSSAKIALASIFDLKKLQNLTINHSKVKASELKNLIEKYMMLFAENDLPEPRNLFIVTAEANNLLTMNSAKECYIETMDDICSYSKPFKHLNSLRKDHDNAYDEAIDLFRSTKKMGDNEFCKNYENKLIQELNTLFERYVHQNEAKKSSSISSFGLKVFTIALFINIVGTILKFLRLKTVASFIIKISYTLVLLMITSSVMKYTNHDIEFFELFESNVDAVFEKLMSLLLNIANERANSRIHKRTSNSGK